MANSNSRRNNFTKIRVGGECFSGQVDIRSSVVKAYRELLSNPRVWRANPKGLNFNWLEEGEAANLEVPFTKTEVKSALEELNGDKAPGPDGFTVPFWQST